LGVLSMAYCVARRLGARSPLGLVGLALLPASEMGLQTVNYLLSKALPPRALPKMWLEDGVPDEFRTLVVVPMLLTHDAINDQVDRLEVHYLANVDANLRFALLADFGDAPQAETEQDANLLKIAVDGINGLNARYGRAAGGGLDPFLLFHRARKWSATEECWMGWERKRGKLEELNAYLTGAGSADPSVLHPVAGDVTLLTGVKFVITLDADTQMPNGAAAHRDPGAPAQPADVRSGSGLTTIGEQRLQHHPAAR
jgi:cyclic beta-1,2-glucan synthetase